jgi:Tfp pilus assembly PilM family ATPase
MSTSSLFQTTPPDVAIEIDGTHVAAARLAWRGPTATVAAHAVEAIPPGAVVPALAAPNIADVAALSRAIADVTKRIGGRVNRGALVIPDTVAKVSLIRFEKIPAKASDLAELVRWQVRKSAPFPIEQAVVGFTDGMTPPEGGRELIVTLARADIVAQYEDACARAGVHTGLVDIATFSLINGVLAGGSAPAGDWLLVHGTPSYTTLAVLRGEHLIFFRNREQDSEGTLADVVHQTAMYYEDRLKGAGFSRVLLVGNSLQGVEDIRRRLEERLAVPTDSVPQPETAALAGILMRERRAA